MSYTLLHAMSGGIDSTSVLVKLLEQGEKPLLLHADFANAQRQRAEKRATQNIIQWADARYGITLDCRYAISANMQGVFDIEAVALLMGGVLRREETISRATVSTSLDDRAQSNWQHRDETRRLITESIANRPIEWIAPNKLVSRAKTIRDMPDDLLRLCSFCRTPNSDYSPCGECYACQQTLPLTRIAHAS